MNIANAGSVMSSAQVGSAVGIAVLKNNMDSTEQIATQLVDQLSNLSVGKSSNKVDISV